MILITPCMEHSSPIPSANLPLEQVIVLGRGLELNSDEYPGTVQYGSPHSGDSYDRGVVAGRYSLTHPEVTSMTFSGDVTFVAPEHERPLTGSEAQGMADVAWEHWAMIPANVEPYSGTTVRNFVNAVRRGFIDPNKATGIIVDERQRRNAVWAGQLVMPHAELRIISPYDNPNLQQTLPEQRLSTDPNMRPTRKDQLSGAIYRIAMLGVIPGDIESIATRDDRVQLNVSRVLKGLRTLKSWFTAEQSSEFQPAA